MEADPVRGLEEQLSEFERAAEQRVREIRELAAQLRKTRVTGQNEAGTVVATANGVGKIIDISISPSALRGPHPHKIGTEIVAAVRAAQRAMLTTISERWQLEFGTNPELTKELFPDARPDRGTRRSSSP